MKFNAMRFIQSKFAIQCETKEEAKRLLFHLKHLRSIKFETSIMKYLDSYSETINCFAYAEFINLVIGSEKAMKKCINKKIKTIKYQNIVWWD